MYHCAKTRYNRLLSALGARALHLKIAKDKLRQKTSLDKRQSSDATPWWIAHVSRTMFSTILFFALLQVVCGLSISRPSRDSNAPSAHLQSRGLDTGSKVAIGICVPAVAFVFGLGIGIMYLYPAQLRKLRRQNPGAEVGLRELMDGRVSRPRQAAPQTTTATHTEPPPYTERHASVAHEATLGASGAPEVKHDLS